MGDRSETTGGWRALALGFAGWIKGGSEGQIFQAIETDDA